MMRNFHSLPRADIRRTPRYPTASVFEMLLSPILFAISLLLAAPTQAEEQPTDSAAGAASPYGAELLQPFKRALQQALSSGMREGPAAAINVCRVQAPQIAAARSKDGVRAGRSSHKLRNPANAAPDWVVPVMAGYVADAADRAPRTISLDGNREGYVEPIIVQPMCLACHGTSLSPEVSELLRAGYPDDQATGFSTGDLRGVFWVEYPREAPSS